MYRRRNVPSNAARLDRLAMRHKAPAMPTLMTGFAKSIRDHEHQIADLVLSICAHALTNGEASLDQALMSIANREAAEIAHPHDLLRSEYMRVEVIDSGLFADVTAIRYGASYMSGTAEGILYSYGFDEIGNLASQLSGLKKSELKPSFNRSSLWAHQSSRLHNFADAKLYREIETTLKRQIDESRLLALPHIYWHSTLALSYLQEAKGEIIAVALPQKLRLERQRELRKKPPLFRAR